MAREKLSHSQLAYMLIDFVVYPFSSHGGINDRELVASSFGHHIASGQPIQIAGFIGQGGKDHLGKGDIELLERYERLQKEITVYYSFGTEVNLIGADMHGISNGIEDRGYLALMQENAQARGLNWVDLSSLYRDKSLSLPNPDQVRLIMDNQTDLIYLAWRDNLPPEIRAVLIKQAGRHNIIDGDSLFRAFYYLVMRKQEETILIPEWQNNVFVINGSRDIAEWTFPQSIGQMYWLDVRDGGRKARNIKLPPPWFRND